MKLGRILGKVWASIKDSKLEGLQLKLMQPVDENDEPMGRTLIAIDTLGTRDNDLVYWVSGAEACLSVKSKAIPSDVTIVGFVDRKNL